MKIQGELVKINQTQTKGTFSFRNFVLKTFGDYPQYLTLQLRKDKCNILDNYKSNDKVDVEINLYGKKWEDPNSKETKYFNTLVAWKLGSYVEEVTAGDQSPDRDDDLPF
tara:strand:- start:668 stop:997 length:330 start_codon:yes stop_codon:yes gene_type:complete